MSTGPLSAAGTPAAAPKPPEAPAAPAAPAAPVPPKAPTGDMSAPNMGQQMRQAADNLLNDKLPWEADAKPKSPTADFPKPPPAVPRPVANRPAFEAKLPAQPRIPDRPQRDTRPLSSRALPDLIESVRLDHTDKLGAFKALQTANKGLAAALAAHVARPDSVVQVPGTSTCVAATVQKTLARQNPELYKQIVSELAMRGVAQLPNGTTLAVSKANSAWIDSKGFSPEQKLNALVQSALMELGAPGDGYMLASDSFAAKPGKAPGLSLDQARKLIETLLKAPMLDPRDLKAKWDGHFLAAGQMPPTDPLTTTPSPELVRKLLGGAEAGTFAVVRARDNAGALLRDADGRPFLEEEEENEENRRKHPPKKTHMVQIVAVDDEAGTVTYIDALGTQRTVEAASFARIMLMTTRSSELEGIGSPLGAAI
jgi:hypothetical protein